MPVPFVYKLTHIHRKDMFGHNWKLNEDKTPLFIKHATIGFYHTKRPKNTCDETSLGLVKHNYDENFILNRIENKAENKTIHLVNSKRTY